MKNGPEFSSSVALVDEAREVSISPGEARERDANFLKKGVVAVYALVDPRDQSVRYIGQSCRPHQRMLEHMSTSLGGWRDDLRLAGFRRPLIRILALAINSTEAKALEREWVTRMLAAGAQLVNSGPELHAGRLSIKADTEMWRALARIERHISGACTVDNKGMPARWEAAIRFALLSCARDLPQAGQ